MVTKKECKKCKYNYSKIDTEKATYEYYSCGLSKRAVKVEKETQSVPCPVGKATIETKYYTPRCY